MGKSKKKAAKRDSPIDHFEVIEILPVEQSVSFLVHFCLSPSFRFQTAKKNLEDEFLLLQRITRAKNRAIFGAKRGFYSSAADFFRSKYIF